MNRRGCTAVDSVTRPSAARYRPDEDLVDWVVIDRLCTGQQTRSTEAERVAAVARMTARGMPAEVIADRMRVSERTVQRLRAALRSAGQLVAS